MLSAPLIPRKISDLKNDVYLFRLALWLWFALAVAVCVKYFLTEGDHSVYPVYAWGSRHWWADQPLHAYYPDLNIDIYRYSPTFAVIFTPFAILPIWLGASLWCIVNIATTLYALHLMAREILPGSCTPRQEAWFLGLTMFGMMAGIWSAQINSLLLSLVIFAAVAVKRQQWWMASFLLALPVFIKIWPIAAALLMIACWPKQLSWRFVIVVVVLALLPFLTRPFNMVVGQYQQWYFSLIEQNKGRWPGFRDAWTIWENIRPPVSRHVYQVLQLASAFLVLLWCLYQRRRIASTGGLLTGIISIWVSWQLLFGPGAEQLTYGILAPSVVWAMLISFVEKKHRLWTALTWLTLVLLSCGELETFLCGIHPAFAALLPLSAVSFAVWLVIYEEKGSNLYNVS